MSLQQAPVHNACRASICSTFYVCHALLFVSAPANITTANLACPWTTKIPTTRGWRYISLQHCAAFYATLSSPPASNAQISKPAPNAMEDSILSHQPISQSAPSSPVCPTAKYVRINWHVNSAKTVPISIQSPKPAASHHACNIVYSATARIPVRYASRDSDSTRKEDVWPVRLIACNVLKMSCSAICVLQDIIMAISAALVQVLQTVCSTIPMLRLWQIVRFVSLGILCCMEVAVHVWAANYAHCSFCARLHASPDQPLSITRV